MKQFRNWLEGMDQMQPPPAPPVNAGMAPEASPDIADELREIAQKLNDLVDKMGGKKGDDSQEIPQPDKGLGDKSGLDKGAVAPKAPNFS